RFSRDWSSDVCSSDLNSTSSSPACPSSVTTSSNSWRLPVSNTGSPLADLPAKPQVGLPLWLLAELTYRCPLQCPYCSNPLDFARSEERRGERGWNTGS